MKEAFALQDFGDRAIDIHSHFNHGSIFDCSGDERHIREFDFFESVYHNANVSQVGISTFATDFETLSKTSDTYLDLTK